MSKNTFALKGDICYSKSLTELETMEQGYLLCKDGLVAGVYKELPEEYKNAEIICKLKGCNKVALVPYGAIALKI